MCNYEILTPALCIILAVSVVAIGLEKVRPESPATGMSSSS